VVRVFGRDHPWRGIVGLAGAGSLVLVYASSVFAGGGLDPAFGGDGKVTTAFDGGGYANAVAAQADGRIVVAGTAAGESGNGDLAVARYRPDGSLDHTFGGDGTVVTAIGSGLDEANAVAVDADGRILVAGHDAGARFALARYLANGDLDAAFGGGDGIVTTDITSASDVANAVAIQTDGRIVVAGRAGADARARFAMARYLADGTLDTTFGGGDGTLRTRVGDHSVAYALALRPDGKIVLAGWSTPGPNFTLARYRKDGTLDPSFGGGDGIVVGPKVGYGLTLGIAFALAIQPDGRMVVGGQDVDRFQGAVARYRADGRLDRTFSDDGWVSVSVGDGDEIVRGLVLRPNGKVVAVAAVLPHEVGDGVEPRIAVLRYTAAGRLDRAFGTNGKVITRFAGGVSATGSASVPGGRIAAVGVALADPPAFAVARYVR
jgi:uncharacterized delta-60 repeat protein